MKVFWRSKLLVILMLVLPYMISSAAGRDIKVMSFDELQPLLYKTTDSVYVVNFWATWCAPCVREIPDFEKLQAEYANQGVKVLLVSLDFPGHLESRVLPFLDRMQVKSEVMLLDDVNSNRWIPLVSENWSGAIPATVIYSGDTRHFFEKELKFEELEAIIKPMLEQ